MSSTPKHPWPVRPMTEQQAIDVAIFFDQRSLHEHVGSMTFNMVCPQIDKNLVIELFGDGTWKHTTKDWV